jgi:hypothetical protein
MVRKRITGNRKRRTGSVVQFGARVFPKTVLWLCYLITSSSNFVEVWRGNWHWFLRHILKRITSLARILYRTSLWTDLTRWRPSSFCHLQISSRNPPTTLKNEKSYCTNLVALRWLSQTSSVVVLAIQYFTAWRLSLQSTIYSCDPRVSLAVPKCSLQGPVDDPHGSQGVKLPYLNDLFNFYYSCHICLFIYSFVVCLMTLSVTQYRNIYIYICIYIHTGLNESIINEK